MKRIVFVMFAVLLGVSGYAWSEDAPELHDFAFGFDLDADGSSGIYKVVLPEEVYRYATRKDLGDLRIFNSSNEIVPHSLQRRTIIKTETEASVVLPIFPIYATRFEGSGYSMDIQTDAHGTIVNINDGKVEKKNRVQAYIVDATKLKHVPDTFVLAWSGDTGLSFTTNVSVSCSNDLNNWSVLVPSTSLAKLTYNNHRLGNYTIELPQKKAKYYKLTWPAGSKGIYLDSLTAELNISKDSRNITWKELDVNYTQKDPVIYEYDAGANLPVEKINVVLPYKNVLFDAVIKSRTDISETWRVRYKGLVYNMEVDGQLLSNEEINISLSTDRYWSLETSSIEGKLELQPKLQLGWIPHELYFVAQGSAPFKLAYGGSDVPPPPVSTNIFFEKINAEQDKDIRETGNVVFYGREGVGKGSSTQFSQGYMKNSVSVKSVNVTNRVELGGEKMLKPKVIVPWKKWVLWSLLVVGVCLLAWMAFNLSKQMKNN